MIFKRFSLFLAVLTLLLTSTSCSDDTSKQAGSDLTIYLTDNDMAVSDAIVAFNNSQRKTKITSESFNVIEDYTVRLQSELASGKGPDIIVLNPYILPNLSKYINAGVFTDLNELIKKDKDFKFEDYNEKILSCGVTDGKRFLLPLSYTIDGLFTTQEILDSKNIRIDEDTFSIEELASLSKQLKASSDQDEMFLANTLSFYPVLSQFADAYKATAQFNSEPFVKFLYNYKEISEALYPADNGSPDLSEPLKNKEVLFINMPIFSFSSMTMPYEKFDSVSEPSIFAAPSVESGTATATPYTIVAINKNCKNKDAAYSFIKSLLEVEHQTGPSSFGLPVNNKGYEKMKEDFLNNMDDSSGSSVISDKSILAKLAEQLDRIVSGNMTCKLTDYEIEKIAREEINTLDTKPADTVSEAIQDRTLSYFNRNDLEAAKAMAQETPQAELPTISIQYMEFQFFIKNAIRTFNETHTDVQINGIPYASKSKDEYRTKLAAGIMAGEAPDIIVYHPDLFNSFSKVLDTGVFCDLNELIAQDETFDESHYYPSVFNAGMHNGKRLFIPLLYVFPYLVTTEEALEKAGINFDESNWNLEELRKMILESPSLSASDNKYFFESEIYFNDFLRYSGIDFIDEKSKFSHFQSKEFIDLIKIYKDILPYIEPQEVDNHLESYNLVKNGTIVMDYEIPAHTSSFMFDHSMYSKELSENVIFCLFPPLQKSTGYPVGISDIVSINQTCANKQAAFDFIEILLSPDIQKHFNSRMAQNLLLGFPINNTILREDIEFINTKASGFYLRPMPLPDRYIDRVIELNNMLGQPIYIDKEVLKIVNEGIQPFLDGKFTAEEAAKNIDEKVEIFLNE